MGLNGLTIHRKVSLQASLIHTLNQFVINVPASQKATAILRIFFAPNHYANEVLIASRAHFTQLHLLHHFHTVNTAIVT